MSIENKRQIESIQEKGQNLSFKNAFENQFDSYLFEKIKKLAIASSLLTDHLHAEEEVIKKDIRETSLSLVKKMSFTFSHKRQNTSFGFYANERQDRYDNIMEYLLKLQSLIQIGSDAFLLNKNNCTIVDVVISELLTEISNQLGEQDVSNVSDEAGLRQPNFFSKTYFDVEKPGSTKSLDYETGSVDSDEYYKKEDAHVSSQEKKVGGKTGGQTLPQKKSSEISKKESSQILAKEHDGVESSVRKNVKSSTNKSQRQEKIIAIIKDKVSVSIKDISSLIDDCSEKTIQRELIELLNNGVIAKEGERRWSTYSMK